MSNYRWRSMSKDLQEGAADGTFKSEIPNTCQDAVPGNKAATLKLRSRLNPLNGFDWGRGRGRDDNR